MVVSGFLRTISKRVRVSYFSQCYEGSKGRDLEIFNFSNVSHKPEEIKQWRMKLHLYYLCTITVQIQYLGIWIIHIVEESNNCCC
jgi:hypothetical protein